MQSVAPCWVLALVALGLGPAAASAASQTAIDGSRYEAPVEVAAGLYLFIEPEGNVLVEIGPRDAGVFGVLSPHATASVRQFLVARHAPPVRFALATDGPNAARYGDGGWGRLGAITIAHERLRARMSAEFKEPMQDTGERDATLPILGFSAVQQLYLSSNDVHAVHQQAGAGDADLSVHFERSDVLFLGNLFTTDGFPDIDPSGGGSIDGLIKTVEFFAAGFGSEPAVRFVPARGPAVDGRGLEEYLQMLRAARARVQALLDAGLDDNAIARRQPLLEFGARWGHGAVSAEQFTARLIASLRPTQP